MTKSHQRTSRNAMTSTATTVASRAARGPRPRILVQASGTTMPWSDPRHRLGCLCRRVYSMESQPSDRGRKGRTVVPTVSCTPAAPTVATKASPPTGAVPSPISSVHVPLKVMVPSAFSEEVVIQPVMVIHWLRPMTLEPLSWTSRSPMALPLVAVWMPRPYVPPASSMPLKVAPAGNRPAPAPVTRLLVDTAAACPRGRTRDTLTTTSALSIAAMSRFVISDSPFTQGRRRGALAAVRAVPPLPALGPLERIWMLPVRSSGPASGCPHPRVGGFPAVPPVVQNVIVNVSLPAPESELSTTVTSTPPTPVGHSAPTSLQLPPSWAVPPVPFGLIVGPICADMKLTGTFTCRPPVMLACLS